MSSTIPALIGQQFGAALDMLENAINACPDSQWGGDSRFWYIAYHTTFWTDYYLSDTPMEKDYQPPKPFTLSEFEDGQLPEREYGKTEVLAFLDHVRQCLQRQLQNNDQEELLENALRANTRILASSSFCSTICAMSNITLLS